MTVWLIAVSYFNICPFFTSLTEKMVYFFMQIWLCYGPSHWHDLLTSIIVGPDLILYSGYETSNVSGVGVTSFI